MFLFDTDTLPYLWTFIIAVILAVLAHNIGVKDTPTARSSHHKPTSKSGGLAIVLPSLLFQLWWRYAQDIEGLDLLAILLSCAFLMAILGFLDDWKSSSPIFRLICHLSISAFVMVFLEILPETHSYYWLTIGIGTLWLTSFTNAFNFMDGLNGLAGGTALGWLGLWLFVTLGSPFLSSFIIALMISIGGFLIFNLRDKLFMGGSGSQYLGFILALLPLVIYKENPKNLIIIPFVYLPFLTDTGWTLIRKLLKGVSFMEAHKMHLYQLLNQAGWSHLQVSLLHFVFSLIYGFGGLSILYVSPLEGALIGSGLILLQMFYGIGVLKHYQEKHTHHG